MMFGSGSVQRSCEEGTSLSLPPSHAEIRQKFSNDSNAVLLCMGLFSTFLMGSRP